MSNETAPGMPDILPWLEGVLASPPMGSREDLALRLHNRIQRIQALQSKILELEKAKSPLAFRHVMAKMNAATAAGKFTVADVDKMVRIVGLTMDSIARLVLPSESLRLFAFNALLDLQDAPVLHAVTPAPVAVNPTYPCGHCGKDFVPIKNQRNHLALGHRIYCSGVCRAAVYPNQQPQPS